MTAVSFKHVEEEYATEASMIGWSGCVESIEVMSSGDSLIRVRRDNSEVLLEVPRSIAEQSSLTPQSVIKATSVRRRNANPLVNDLTVLNRAETLPVDLADPDFSDTRNRHLHIRTPQLRAAAMFRHFLQKHIREFLDAKGFYNVQTPILTEASCVCSGDVFAFPYYNKKIANLIQSPWMYADALVAGVGRVYALNPSFRRERDATNIHLVEIWQLQVDLTWAGNEDAMALEEEMLRHIASQFLEKHQDLYELAGLNSGHLEDLLKPYHRITYDESLVRLKSLGHDLPYGSDYSKEQSDALSATFSAPYFVTDYPQELKNFWFPSYEKGGRRLTPSNDLFAHTGHGEIIGGGERVNNAQELSQNLEFFGHDQDEFDWFLETRRYGCPPHAGFSTGFDRLAALVMGVDHILEATLFPRLPNGTIRP